MSIDGFRFCSFYQVADLFGSGFIGYRNFENSLKNCLSLFVLCFIPDLLFSPDLASLVEVLKFFRNIEHFFQKLFAIVLCFVPDHLFYFDLSSLIQLSKI